MHGPVGPDADSLRLNALAFKNAESLRAEELDPLNFRFYSDEAFNYFLARKYEKAVAR